jgi:hypothetical protein
LKINSFEATQQSYDKIVQLLLDKFANPNLQDNTGQTALIYGKKIIFFKT